MKQFFAVGVLGLIVFEIANVYFIMPMPGSQRMRSLDVAYALYQWRWPIRVLCGVLIGVSALPTWQAAGRRKWLIPAALALAGVVTYLFNFRLSADQMFREPTKLDMAPAAKNRVASDRLVVGIEINGDARAYPLQFIGYHHQVRDTVGGQEVLVSYCTVCRTGRVFTPVVEGQVERFRLVGMDQFNAMFEDETTGSWWRQANGEAIAGSRKGTTLPEIPSVQVTLKRWLSLHPTTLVMQGDSAFTDDYAKDYTYERGTSRKQLTGTDTLSWRDKSWVVGISLNDKSKAYDWNRLRRERSVNDEVGGVPIVLVLASDNESFFAFQRPDAGTRFALRGDSLVSEVSAYDLSGHGPTGRLTPLVASQEFWHSWRSFQPGTLRY